MNKQTLITILCICAVAGLAITIGYAMISNTVVVTPKITAVGLIVNDATPAVGDIVTFTATLAQPVDDVPVTFYINAVSIATIDTTAGVSTFQVLIDDLTVLNVYAEIP